MNKNESWIAQTAFNAFFEETRIKVDWRMVDDERFDALADFYFDLKKRQRFIVEIKTEIRTTMSTTFCNYRKSSLQ